MAKRLMNFLSSAASAAATAGKIAVDAGANLAKETAEVAKETAEVAKTKAGEMRDAAMERIGETTAGKIAAAIRAQGGTEASAPMDDSNAAVEVAASAKRDQRQA